MRKFLKKIGRGLRILAGRQLPNRQIRESYAEKETTSRPLLHRLLGSGTTVKKWVTRTPEEQIVVTKRTYEGSGKDAALAKVSQKVYDSEGRLIRKTGMSTRQAGNPRK